MMQRLIHCMTSFIVLLSMIFVGLLGMPGRAIAAPGDLNFQPIPIEGLTVKSPTSLQFGPDDRLYVSQLNGTVKSFAIALETDELDGEKYIASDEEILLLSNGQPVVKSILNHNDDGTVNPLTNRQVTGIAITGTATAPVLYVSSSDPRIATERDTGLDTNSGVVTRLTRQGDSWEAVDVLRGFPRSEENHSVNGMVFSQDGTKLYLTVGGNTNNGAPSFTFAYTGEYALSSTVLEIDLIDLESRPILNDPKAGQGGTARPYIYDFPTLDDPTVENLTDGRGEDDSGLDEAGPWGGNDGFNQAILPADAPLRIFADGVRNIYDLVLTQSGQLYTLDNGANADLGGNPLDANGVTTDQPGAGPPTHASNNLGTGDREPLFLLEDGGYYGHPVPVRAAQTMEWVVYDDTGAPDTTLPVTTIPDISSLVPASVAMPPGFVVAPSKFTGDAVRLAESGIRIDSSSPNTNALAKLFSSSNGMIEYTGDAFDGALDGVLLVANLNGKVVALNPNDAGTAMDPIVAPGEDGILGSGDDEVLAQNGVFNLLNGLTAPIDLAIGDNGTLWVAEIFGNDIKVFGPSVSVAEPLNDADNDGLLNVEDPFVRDATNGGAVVLMPGETLVWDFDANQDNNLPGPSGYAAGLTGVMVNGVTDFEAFLNAPTNPAEPTSTNIDNIKFATAAGGGTTVIETVSPGDALGDRNDGQFLFHTGLTVAPEVSNLTVKWTVFNPASLLAGPFQQIGGYLGTGDQSNYLKLVAIQAPEGELQVLLENGDAVQASDFLPADDLFTQPEIERIVFELAIDLATATATPTITYDTSLSSTATVSGAAVDLSGTAVLDAIRGNYQVKGQTTGLALGLYASNTGQAAANTFQAIFDGIEVVAASATPPTDQSPEAASDGASNTGVRPESPSIIVWEAEDSPEITKFVLETKPAASGGKLLKARGRNNTAVFNFQEAAGVYDIALGTFDEGDGQSRFQLFKNDGLVGEIILNQDPGSDGADETTRVTPTIAPAVPLTPGDRLMVKGRQDFAEPARLDFVQLTPVIAIPDSPQTDPDPEPDPVEGPGESPNAGAEEGELGAFGAAVVTITPDGEIQTSNYGQNSFQITNTGNKPIAQVTLDVTNALYPDAVFDPFGEAGDAAFKGLTLDTNDSTGVVAPSNAVYLGPGGAAGYRSLQLTFDEAIEGGFETGETLGFSIDMDPNSIAGVRNNSLLLAGTSPRWDVGGISGAELIGSTVIVTFTDGTSASGQLQGTGNQAGSQTLVSQAAPNSLVTLTVNGLSAGDSGTYDGASPRVVVTGAAGETARVVLTKGFIQPVTNEFVNGSASEQAFAPILQAQLDALAASVFPANNAVEFQTVDVLLTGTEQDISSQFDFSQVPIAGVAGADQLPLGFVASILDADADNLPLGPVTAPIYLTFAD